MNILNIKKRYKIIVGILLLLVIILFSVPRIGRWYIVKHSYELVGRKMDIEKIRFNYFSGALRIHNLIIFEEDSRTVFISFQKLLVNLDYLPLFRNEFFIKNIAVDDPYMEVLQNGDKFNFSDLTAADSTTVKADTIPVQPTKYIINNIRISRGNVKYTDLNLNHTIALRNVDLLIPGFTWNSDSTNLDINFRFVDGGGLYSSLGVNQADSTYSVNLKLDSLNLDILEPYFQSNLYISALHGYLTNDLVIKGNMQSVMQLTVHGINHIYGMRMVDTLNRTIFSSDDLTVDIDTFRFDKNRISLNYIGITNPYILFELIDSTNNWLGLLKPSADEKADTLSQKPDTTIIKDESSFRFSRFQISGGKLQFSDKTLRYPFEYNIDNIVLESSPVANLPGKISVGISAGLNGTGSFKADATFNPDNAGDADIAMSIKQFSMKDVDAYFRHYFGFPVTGGRMNFSTENKMRAESLISSNALYFRKFTLNKQRDEKREYNIPLRLALGIMSDKDGIIDLKTPVEMKGEDVKVKNLGKIVFRILGNLFVKAAASPVNMLADLFKVDPAKLREIHFPLTEPSPDLKNLESVDILADILSKKPGLSIDFIYCINYEKTADTLAHMLALEDFIEHNALEGGKGSNVPDSILTGYLLGKIASDSLAVKRGIIGMCRSYIGAATLNARIDSIKQSQTSFILSYLIKDKEITGRSFQNYRNKARYYQV